MAKKKRGRRASAGANLASLSMTELQREIARRGRKVQGLMRRRARLMARVDRLDSIIREHGGSAGGGARRGPGRPAGRGAGRGGRRGGRGENSKSLAQSLADLLKGKTMGVTEAAEAVKAAGYKTSAENFRTMVNLQLIKSGLFKRVGRGQYTAA